MLQRHSLVWLSEEGWERTLAALPEEDRAQADPWPRHNWPAVVRRPDSATASVHTQQVALGLSAVSDTHRSKCRRIALVASADDVMRNGMPLPLSEAAASAPGRWRDALAALANAGDEGGITLRTYGSLAWQHLTGVPCMTPRSDIDLLFHPTSAAQLDRGLELLAAQAKQLPLDGEIVFPNGDAVAWKEWRQACSSSAGCRVLVKHLNGVRLAPAAALLTMFS